MTPIQELIEEYSKKRDAIQEKINQNHPQDMSNARLNAKRTCYDQIVRSLKDSLEKEKQEIIEAFDYFGNKLEEQAKDYIIKGAYIPDSIKCGEEYYNSKYLHS